jgi:hypothetical protein
MEPGGPPDPESGVPPFEFYEPARYAMGDTRRYAELMQLLEMTPRGDLSSTGFALANPGAEYLVLQPNDAGGPFTVTLEAGTYAAEWHSISTRATQPTGTVTIGAAESVPFVSPFSDPGPVVLYLKRAQLMTTGGFPPHLTVMR